MNLKYFIKNPLQIPIVLITKLPFFSFIRETIDYQNRITFGTWFNQKILNIGNHKDVYWPVHKNSTVYDYENILIGIDAYPGNVEGCYIQGGGKITIGDYTQIAPYVAIISANHDLYDTRKHILSPVEIGKYCWIGTGAKIMPGVKLGDWTIVGAGAVVTKSFPDGYCVIGGTPAREIKKLDRSKCVPFKNRKEYYGYIKKSEFEAYRKKFLNI